MGSIGNSTAAAATAFSSFSRNKTYIIPGIYDLEIEDTNWVMTSSFIIFTMQTGNYYYYCDVCVMSHQLLPV